VAGAAAGGFHSLALKADGTTVAWGWNDFGQCNVPNRNNVSTLFLLLGNRLPQTVSGKTQKLAGSLINGCDRLNKAPQ
jgi:alpha-tubulin suppressor-like RCC1 family protein